MRSNVILALVIMGGIVIITPVIAQYLLKANHQDKVAQLLQSGAGSVSIIPAEMGEYQSFGCWLTGTMMVIAGIVLSRQSVANSGSKDMGGTA